MRYLSYKTVTAVYYDCEMQVPTRKLQQKLYQQHDKGAFVRQNLHIIFTYLRDSN